jgi:hypothetical protein
MPTDWQMAQARSSLLYCTVFLHLVVTVEADRPMECDLNTNKRAETIGRAEAGSKTRDQIRGMKMNLERKLGVGVLAPGLTGEQQLLRHTGLDDCSCVAAFNA